LAEERIVPVSCEEVLRELSNYMDHEVDAGLRARMVEHFRSCTRCSAILDGASNVVRLVGDNRSFPLPSGFSERLRQRLAGHIAPSAARPATQVPLGIGEQYVRRGDHIAYFWETEQQFEEAVNFLRVGLEGDDACFVFGHDQANQKVLAILGRRGVDVEWFRDRGRLQVIAGRPSAEAMLEEIGGQFQAALTSGAPLLRLLGNLGWGRQNWPDDDGILAFEARVTEAARNFPCVVLCLYDVWSLSGRIILKGGLETHPCTVRHNVLRENSYFVPAEEFLRRLQGTAGPVQ